MSQVIQEEEIVAKQYDLNLIRRLLTYVVPYKGLVILGVFLLISTSLTDLAGPYIIKIAIDNYIAQGNFRGLLFISVVYFIINLLSFLFRYLQSYATGVLGQKIMYDLRMELFSKIQSLSLSFFDRTPVGRIVTRVTNDVDSLNELLTSGMVTIIGDTFTLLGITVLIFWLNWKLAIVTMLVVPVLVVITNFLQKRMRAAFRALRVRLSRINAFISENVSGMHIVQLFNREDKNFQQFDDLNQDYKKSALRSLFYFALFGPLLSLITASATALVIWFGGRSVIAETLTIGSLVAFLQYVDRFFLPIRDLSEKYNALQSAMAACERIFQLLDEQPAIKDAPDAKPLQHIRGEIEFKNVWFAYNDDDWVLKDVSFKVSPGESVALVGATGAGKTSIISLLCRFYDIQKGQILIDGIDIKEISIKDLRRHIGLVLQDPFLFTGTIASNIRLHESSISDQQVEEAARYVNAHTFIEKLHLKYNEPVLERGAGLSHGQRQLISFARAIAFNPELLLILDEATSSIDTETEALIQEALAKIMKGRTSIVIAHRLSTVQNVDRIIVMHKGRIVEQGSHQELLAQRGYYYRLYELQYRSEAIA